MAALRLTRALFAEVAHLAYLTRGRIVFLVQTEAQADRLSNRFRKVLSEESVAEGWWANSESLTLPFKSNPSFVQLYCGGWVFFQAIGDLGADEDVGPVQWVYWPTEGGTYERVSYDFWRTERRKGSIYRSILVAEVKTKTRGARTAWDIILEEDDD
jgi:hypothetical protein